MNKQFVGFEVKCFGTTLEWTDNFSAAEKCYNNVRSSAQLIKHDSDGNRVLKSKISTFRLADSIVNYSV